jgi:serine/threonine-protein kinase
VNRSAHAAPIQFDGTPMYVSPEQLNGDPVDARTDLYSLGAVLYELLTGEPPFTGGSTVAVLAARVLRPPPDPCSLRPELGPEIAQIITRCLAVSPADRYPHAGELSAALRQAVQRLSSDQTQALVVPSRSTQPSPPPAAAEATRDGLPAVSVEAAEAADVAGLMTARMPARPPQATHSLLVARIENLGPREDEDLAQGLGRELSEALSALPGMYVYGHAALTSLPAGQREPLAAARALAADWLLRGTLRRSSDTLRLSLQLLRSEPGSLVFSARSDCREANLLSLAESLIADLALALGLPAPPAEPTRAASGTLSALSPAAAREPAGPGLGDDYLRARAMYERGDLQSVQQGVQMLERALTRTPGDPRLLMYFALAQSRLWFYGDSDAAAHAIAAAERLVALQPRRAESHLALASVRFQGADALGAVQATVKALSIRPDLPDAHELLGRILIETGPVREGLEHLAKARSLDPALVRVIADQARVLALLGRFDRAHELLADRSLIEQSFAIQWILRARLCMWQKDTARAEAYLRDPELVAGKYPRARLLFAAAARRTRIEPADVLAAGLASDKTSPRGRTFFFQMHAELQAAHGQHEQAVRSVARSVDAGLSDLLWLEHCPLLVPLLQDSRIAALRQVVYSRAFAVREALASLPRGPWSVASPASASTAASK